MEVYNKTRLNTDDVVALLEAVFVAGDIHKDILHGYRLFIRYVTPKRNQACLKNQGSTLTLQVLPPEKYQNKGLEYLASTLDKVIPPSEIASLARAIGSHRRFFSDTWKKYAGLKGIYWCPPDAWISICTKLGESTPIRLADGPSKEEKHRIKVAETGSRYLKLKRAIQLNETYVVKRVAQAQKLLAKQERDKVRLAKMEAFLTVAGSNVLAEE